MAQAKAITQKYSFKNKREVKADAKVEEKKRKYSFTSDLSNEGPSKAVSRKISASKVTEKKEAKKVEAPKKEKSEKKEKKKK